MAKTTKTAGKTATKKTAKLSALLSMFEESTSKWVDEGEKLALSDEEIELVVECKAKCYAGEFGEFTKLYLSIMLDNKRMTLKDEGRTGVKLDACSTRRLDLSEGQEVDVDPSKVVLYHLRNTEDDSIVTRVRVLK